MLVGTLTEYSLSGTFSRRKEEALLVDWVNVFVRGCLSVVTM